MVFYLHRMNELMMALVREVWTLKEIPEPGKLRYLTVRLLHELTDMSCESEPETCFTRSQIAIVKEAEALIMQDLSRRITAKEMADRFGISESSFKLYIKGILGRQLSFLFSEEKDRKSSSIAGI